MQVFESIRSFFVFIGERYPDILSAAGQHGLIAAIATILGIVVAIPVAIMISSSEIKWVNSLVFSVANLFQTIPSLALLALMIPLFGIGMTPAIVALFLYSLLPLLRNTYAGLQAVDPALRDASKGMGYSRLQSLFQIELPLAVPYIMSGIRITTVYIISWTTLAGLIGAGGLGQLIMSGLGVNKTELIVAGALSAILFALLADLLLGALEKAIRPNQNSAKA
ncbi:ABC transporter permease [Paenibacillus sp. An7]|uniref:ABC transporter permease n=1 Tax=Paenibacillus sp. An7 TaxID=2689577 RepID=UPI0013580E36|nr:ABC transporter permease [Paenibacillus sp. An7]